MGKKDKKHNGLSPDDTAVWETVKKSVKAYRSAAPKAEKTASSKKGAATTPAAPKKRTEIKTATPKTTTPRGGADGHTLRNMRRGDFAVEARIDLHGMTQDKAHKALMRFLVSCKKNGKRQILIITGKGRLSEGVLRKMLPLWLEAEMGRDVLAITQAHIKDGGGGAFYVRLRKPKD